MGEQHLDLFSTAASDLKFGRRGKGPRHITRVFTEAPRNLARDVIRAAPRFEIVDVAILLARAITAETVSVDAGARRGGQDFMPRLKKWMSFWEEAGRRHGLKADSGFLLGGKAPGIADIMAASLWSTMTDRFSKIEAILGETAPMTAALTCRNADLPPLAKLAAKTQQDYGDAYCGGKIEDPLRKVLDA
jgi:glutathione S-transferase